MEMVDLEMVDLGDWYGRGVGVIVRGVVQVSEDAIT
jgi:hypothetical protein